MKILIEVKCINKTWVEVPDDMGDVDLEDLEEYIAKNCQDDIIEAVGSGNVIIEVL